MNAGNWSAITFAIAAASRGLLSVTLTSISRVSIGLSTEIRCLSCVVLYGRCSSSITLVSIWLTVTISAYVLTRCWAKVLPWFSCWTSSPPLRTVTNSWVEAAYCGTRVKVNAAIAAITRAVSTRISGHWRFSGCRYWDRVTTSPRIPARVPVRRAAGQALDGAR